MYAYTPDNWVVIKIFGDKVHHRVLAGTSGGYLSGDSWKINSGVVTVQQDGDYFLFKGASGSIYKCHKDAYCLRRNTAYIWREWQETYGDKVIMMPEDTNWTELDWSVV